MPDADSPPLGLSPVGFAVLAAQEAEHAMARLIAVTPLGQGSRAHVIHEVDRRRNELDMSQADAIRSVTDDVITGRWRP